MVQAKAGREATWGMAADCPWVTCTDGQKRPQLSGQLYCWAVLPASFKQKGAAVPREPQGTKAGLMQWCTLQLVCGATKTSSKKKKYYRRIDLLLKTEGS